MKNQKHIIFLGIGIAVLLVSFLFVKNNERFYKRTILKITEVEQQKSRVVNGPNGEEEQYYKQQITATVMNTKEKGKKVQFENEYSKTGYKSERYQKGDRVFIKTQGDGALHNIKITGVKRDYLVVALVGIFALALLYIAKGRGFMTLISVAINLTVFVIGIRFMNNPEVFSRFWIIMVGIFCSITLIMAGGFHKKTWGSILSSLITIILVWGVYFIVTRFTKEPPYELMEYISGPHELPGIFMASVITGSLGAIMDVTITIHAGINELVLTTPEISLKEMVHSVREIGMDIMGTMINVLFFVYLSGTLTSIFVEMRNGFGFSTIVKFDIVFELIRFMLGAIGIVLAIPVSGICALVLFYGLRRKQA